MGKKGRQKSVFKRKLKAVHQDLEDLLKNYKGWRMCMGRIPILNGLFANWDLTVIKEAMLKLKNDM